MTARDKWRRPHLHKHILSSHKTNPCDQITVTQHNVSACGVSICKVSGGWSCKDVNGDRHRASLVWQGRLLPLTEERGHSIKPDGSLDPKLSRVSASDKMNSLNNESIWDLWVMARCGPSLNGHPLLIQAKSIDSFPLCECCNHTYTFSISLHCSAIMVAIPLLKPEHW